MNANQNSRLRHPLTRLHPLLIILAALAVFTLATAPVNAAPRQQGVDFCDTHHRGADGNPWQSDPRGHVLNHHQTRNSRMSPDPWLSRVTAAPA